MTPGRDSHDDDPRAGGSTPTHDAGPTRSAQLNAPWRESWIMHLAAEERRKQGDHDPTEQPLAATPAPDGACFLKRYWQSPNDDPSNFVVVRTGSPETNRGGMILLNAYPYTGGHLLVALGDGRPRLTDYDADQQRELWSLVGLASELCEDVLKPQGMNIGMNVGRAAGAGVPEHAHVHVIPRWFGDVNFLTAAGNVRLINASLERFYQQYADAWRRLRERHPEATHSD